MHTDSSIHGIFAIFLRYRLNSVSIRIENRTFKRSLVEVYNHKFIKMQPVDYAEWVLILLRVILCVWPGVASSC